MQLRPYPTVSINALCFMICLVILAGGCNTTDPKITALQTEIATLKQQNADLQEKVSQCATTAETTEAFPQPRFEDIGDVPTKSFIEDLAMLNVLDPQAKTFKPYDTITRGEFVRWLYNAHNAIMPPEQHLRLSPGTKPAFKDVATSHPSFPYAQALAAAGFSVGYTDGTFKPDQLITREEMIAIKTAVDAGKEVKSDKGNFLSAAPFTDAKAVDDRFIGYFQHAESCRSPLGNSIQNAFGNIRTLKPKQAVLRYEAAGALWQFGGGLGGSATTAADILKDHSKALPSNK